MIFKKVVFKNYRLLHDVTIDFSVSDTKPLTVIRGANGFGKTTMLDALRWVFFGSTILSPEYKIADKNLVSAQKSVQASVEVCFSRYETRISPKGGKRKQVEIDYRIKRTVTEQRTETKKASRGKDGLALYEKVKGRWVPKEKGVEILLRSFLPSNVSEVFFINGDKALTFVDAENSDERRQMVKKAATEMLDTALLRNAADRVKSALISANKAEQNLDVATQKYSEAVKRKAEAGDLLQIEEGLLSEKRIETNKSNKAYVAADSAFIAEVAKGDKVKVAERLESIRRGKKQAVTEEENALKGIVGLLHSNDLVASLLAKPLKEAGTHLKEVSTTGLTSPRALATLKGLLEEDKCFCGSSIAKGTGCRKHIESRIKDHDDADEAEDLFDGLRHVSNRLNLKELLTGWKAEKNSLEKNHQEILGRLDGWGGEEAEVEAELELLKESNVEELRRARSEALKEKDLSIAALAKSVASVKDLEKQVKERSLESDVLKKALSKNNAYRTQIDISNDLISVIEAAREIVLTTQVEKLSQNLSKEFLKMTGQSSQDETAIKSAELTPEFDIQVHSQDGMLNPANELSGAQKRALTFSFILSLVGVSGVNAPIVVDTPLGMSEGPVKREILRRLINGTSSQLIMFLTRSEIMDCEDLIKESAGLQMTITNTGSDAVINRPKEKPTILVCECGISTECKVCAIKSDFGD